MNAAAEPSNQAIAGIPAVKFDQMMHQQFRSGIPSLFNLDITLLTVKYGFAFKKFHPFFEIFDEMMGRFMDHGIYNLKPKRMINPKQSDNLGAQILTMDHLELGFAACMIPLALAIVVFLCELLADALKKLRSRRKYVT